MRTEAVHAQLGSATFFVATGKGPATGDYRDTVYVFDEESYGWVRAATGGENALGKRSGAAVVPLPYDVDLCNGSRFIP